MRARRAGSTLRGPSGVALPASACPAWSRPEVSCCPGTRRPPVSGKERSAVSMGAKASSESGLSAAVGAMSARSLLRCSSGVMSRSPGSPASGSSRSGRLAAGLRRVRASRPGRPERSSVSLRVRGVPAPAMSNAPQASPHMGPEAMRAAGAGLPMASMESDVPARGARHPARKRRAPGRRRTTAARDVGTSRNMNSGHRGSRRAVHAMPGSRGASASAAPGRERNMY